MSQVQRVYCYLGQQPQLVFLVPDGCAQLGLTPGDLTQLPIQQGVSAFPGGGTACTDNTAILEVQTLECSSTILSSEYFANQLFTSFRVQCPPGCASKPLAVYGDTVYREDSSVCRAAVF